MKKVLPFLTLVLTLAFATPSLLLLPPVAAVLVGCSGCAGKGQLNPNTGVYDTQAQADKIIVTAEKTGKIAADVFRDFMKFERENELALSAKSPAIHKLAEEVRAHGETWINDLDKAKVAYQSNRASTDAKVNLQQVLAVIQSAIASVLEYKTNEKK